MRNLELEPFNTWRRDMLLDYCDFGGLGQRHRAEWELKCPPEVGTVSRAREFRGLALMLEPAHRRC